METGSKGRVGEGDGEKEEGEEGRKDPTR